MHLLRRVSLVVLVALLLPSTEARAADRLCDSSFEDCRAPLLTLIRNEQVGIDVAFWFMEDARYQTAIIDRFRAGVPVRIIIDTEANKKYTLNVTALNAFRDAGIPMLEKTNSGIVHWKMMLFAGQNVVEFSGANFSPHAFVPNDPYRDYLDEVIVFNDDPAIVNSFKTRYDDVWVSTTGYTNYANISSTRTRRYPVFPIDSRMNFPPFQSFANRSVGRYNAETRKIDSTMFRITDGRHTDALVAAMARGVSFRLITDEEEYRDPAFLWNAYNVDRLYMAARQYCPTTCGVRMEAHLGSLHQKSTLLYNLGLTIFGSSNWTTASSDRQLEHNIFTTSATYFQFFERQFERKWNNSNPVGAIETKPHVPLPPDPPVYVSPANAAQGQALSVTLKWHAGPWAHLYDIYLGTDPTNLALIAANQKLGPSETPTDYATFPVSGLVGGTTYYWRVVSKTIANVPKSGPIWNFRTSGAGPVAGTGDVVLYAAQAPTRTGKWTVVADSTAAAGARIATTNAGIKLGASANPADYFEMSFEAASGVPYRLWVRGKAQSNAWANDSVFVQFNGSVTSGGSATYRIGTTSATTVTIEDCSGCGLSGWGWNDNAIGVGVLGPEIYFASSGTQRIRVQMREDGLSIDQIVLSRGPYLASAPGATKNDGTILQAQGGSAGGTPPPPPPPPAEPLPEGWLARDVGAVGPAGSAFEDSGVFTVKGAGADVWGTTDAFHYAYQPLVGDGTITARVADVEGTQAWTKMGVMMRASTASNAAHAFMLVSVARGLAFQRRPVTGGTSASTSGAMATAPRWVRLERTGDLVAAYESANGSSWTLVGSATIALPDTALVGLVAHSHTTSSVATATFDNVSVEP
jgi:phosphatidylserine/phosphatidylglycerophosphate/cardiolipin synthase-like enzyme/regulation of enolase protein 1 (concanavalin A-like superfamily)